jgi:hypothetical protein
VTQGERDAPTYVAVATDQGVYYTQNISATNPVWASLNDGLLSAEDKNVHDLWRKPGNAGFEALWAATDSGIWRNVSPFSGGSWEKLSTGNPPNAWNDSPAPTASDLTYTAISGRNDPNPAVYALAEWQNEDDVWRGWLLKTEDDGLTWTCVALKKSGGMLTDGTYYYGQYESLTNEAAGVVTISGQGYIGEEDGNYATLTLQDSNYKVTSLVIDMGGAVTGTNMIIQTKYSVALVITEIDG